MTRSSPYDYANELRFVKEHDFASDRVHALAFTVYAGALTCAVDSAL